MKRRIITSLALILAVTTAAVVYQSFLFKRLSASLHRQADIIAEGYQTLVTDDLQPLQEEFPFTASQAKTAKRITDASTELAEAEALEDKLKGISMLQLSLVTFLTSVTAEQPFVKDGRLVHLQKEMGERGDMRELLRDYNTTALRWNNAVQSELGSLTAQVGGNGRSLLPYLRFDGEQEFVTIVEL